MSLQQQKKAPPPSLIIILVGLLLLLEEAAAAGKQEPKYERTVVKQPQPKGLRMDYYMKECPSFEAIVYKKLEEWYTKDWTLAPSILRMIFHDCAVRGCDGSILLDHAGSEKRSEVGKKLRGYEVIDDIKKELEAKCPKTVSCSDILVAASRDATKLAGGPYWENKYGRKDGKTSQAKEADATPAGYEDTTYLIEYFQSMGLNHLDLVVLSGAHTIGRCTCKSIEQRLYNHSGVAGASDPEIAPKYLNYLRRKCRWSSEHVYLDGETPFAFDKQYYKNLIQHMGLLETDQLLYSDDRTRPIVLALADQKQLFYHQFPVSMHKLTAVDVLLEDEGEVRTDCKFVNKH